VQAVVGVSPQLLTPEKFVHLHWIGESNERIKVLFAVLANFVSNQSLKISGVFIFGHLEGQSNYHSL
jgi:hypothetical protein